jgi:putative transposase
VVGANPIEAYVQTKLEQAKKTRKAAAELAHAVKLLASAPTVRTPVGPSRPVETGTAESTATQTVPTSPTVTAVELAARAPVRPKKLSIDTGQVF